MKRQYKLPYFIDPFFYSFSVKDNSVNIFTAGYVADGTTTLNGRLVYDGWGIDGQVFIKYDATNGWVLEHAGTQYYNVPGNTDQFPPGAGWASLAAGIDPPPEVARDVYYEIAGAGVTSLNRIYTLNPLLDKVENGYEIRWDVADNRWELGSGAANVRYVNTSTADSPPLVGWTSVDPSYDPAPTLQILPYERKENYITYVPYVLNGVNGSYQGHKGTWDGDIKVDWIVINGFRYLTLETKEELGWTPFGLQYNQYIDGAGTFYPTQWEFIGGEPPYAEVEEPVTITMSWISKSEESPGVWRHTYSATADMPNAVGGIQECYWYDGREFHNYDPIPGFTIISGQYSTSLQFSVLTGDVDYHQTEANIYWLECKALDGQGILGWGTGIWPAPCHSIYSINENQSFNPFNINDYLSVVGCSIIGCKTVRRLTDGSLFYIQHKLPTSSLWFEGLPGEYDTGLNFDWRFYCYETLPVGVENEFAGGSSLGMPGPSFRIDAADNGDGTRSLSPGSVTGTGPFVYVWEATDGATINPDPGSGVGVTIPTEWNGKVLLTITDANGCVGERFRVFGTGGTDPIGDDWGDPNGTQGGDNNSPGANGGDPPTFAAFTATPSNCSSTVLLDASASVSDNPLSYTWDFGDGSGITTSNSSVTHDFPGPGEYTVTLTATGTINSNSDTISHQVIVNSNFAANLNANYSEGGTSAYAVDVQATPQGGLPPYDYAWVITGAQSSSGNGSSRQMVIADGKSATVEVTVTDSNNPQCSVIATYKTTPPPSEDLGNTPDPCPA